MRMAGSVLHARPPMKMLIGILLLAEMPAAVRAQEADRVVAVRPDIEPDIVSEILPAIVPGKVRGNSASHFWTRSTIALMTLDGAAKAADSFATRRNINDGGEEHDPLARPFVHTTGVQVVATAALFGVEVVTAYILRRRHENVGRAVLAGGAVMNGLGAATSFKHGVASW